ncbi:MAG: GNAT family N-acetyltransferase [Candidatus Eremiobacteraeota bacterium]|nr:GNAT family N-acetyltransferase [Candidatus Eremiobacteraeota bacterium]
MNYAMREADDADVRFIVDLFHLPHVKQFLNAPNAGMVQGSIDDPNNENYIVESDGEPVGNFLIKNHEWLFDFAILIVREPGRGAGSFALEWGLRHAFIESDAHRIFLEIRENNARIRRMVARLGFKEEGCYRDGFRDQSTGRYENLIPYGLLASEYAASA